MRRENGARIRRRTRVLGRSAISAPEYIFGTEPNAFLTTQAGLFKPGQRVLDIACGEGRNSVWLAQRRLRRAGHRRLAARAQEGAEPCRQTRGDSRAAAGGRARAGSGRPRAFDAVVCIFIQFAAPAERSTAVRWLQDHAQTRRRAGPAGVHAQAGRVQDRRSAAGRAHVHAARCCERPSPSCEILHLREHEDMLAEGTKHVGRSALIDLVARKPD